MKKLLTAVTLFCAALSAHADMTFYMKNTSGGRIELYDSQLTAQLTSLPLYSNCNPTDYIAKAWRGNGDGTTIYGCMTFNNDAETINVYWPASGENRTYRLSDFTQTPYVKAQLARYRQQHGM